MWSCNDHHDPIWSVSFEILYLDKSQWDHFDQWPRRRKFHYPDLLGWFKINFKPSNCSWDILAWINVSDETTERPKLPPFVPLISSVMFFCGQGYIKEKNTFYTFLFITFVSFWCLLFKLTLLSSSSSWLLESLLHHAFSCMTVLFLHMDYKWVCQYVLHGDLQSSFIS